MNEEKESYNPVKPLIRPDKNFVFKDNKYPIDFGLIKKYSNYFYNKRKQYKSMKDIPLQLDEYGICEESIPMFIACCQNQPFEITNSTVFSLYKLSIQYDVPELYKLSDEYIKKNHKNLVLQSIQFNIQNRNSEVNIDLSKEEEMISSHFFEYINDEQLSSLPIHILYRIINGHQLNFNSMNSNDQNQFIEFLFKCLDKHKREASVLFTKLDFGNGRVDLFSRLLRDYSKDFDFGMINPKFMMITFSELLSDLNKLEIASTNKISEMQSEIKKQQELLASYQKSFDELKISFENQIENLQKEISEQRKSQDEHKIEYENMKEKMIEMEKIIKDPSNFNKELNKRLVTHIGINPEKSFIVVGKAMTFTAKVTPSNALNNDVEWKVVQQEEGSVEIVDRYKKNITIKGIKQGKKVRILAASIDGSGIEAEKELFTSYFKCEFNVNVQSNQIIKGTIQITEMGATLDKEKSKYLLNTDSSKVMGESSYSLSSNFENLTQNVIFIESKGIYYLHVLAVDNYGNSEEFISNSITINDKNYKIQKFTYTGSVQKVDLVAGTYKLEVWGAQGGDYNNIHGGKGGYSTGNITLSNDTTLFIYVGGKGDDANVGKSGGWNGGGNFNNRYGISNFSCGGGGATDISLNGVEGSKDWNNTSHLYSRIIVAGGGSGAGHVNRCDGGFGGGVVGGGSLPASQTGPGNNGSFGVGANEEGEGSCPDGAAGGGWYGGGSYGLQKYSSPSGGGSGYVYTESTKVNYPSGCLLNSSYYLKDASTKGGNTTFPNVDGGANETGHSGNGVAKITFLSF